jgi:hypothetical protein
MGVARCLALAVGTASEDKQPPLKPLCNPQEHQSNELIYLFCMSETLDVMYSYSSSHHSSNSGKGADGEANNGINFAFIHLSGSDETFYYDFGYFIQWRLNAASYSGKTDMVLTEHSAPDNSVISSVNSRVPRLSADLNPWHWQINPEGIYVPEKIQRYKCSLGFASKFCGGDYVCFCESFSMAKFRNHPTFQHNPRCLSVKYIFHLFVFEYFFKSPCSYFFVFVFFDLYYRLEFYFQMRSKSEMNEAHERGMEYFEQDSKAALDCDRSCHSCTPSELPASATVLKK